MSAPRMRPLVERAYPVLPEVLIEGVRAALLGPGGLCQGKTARRHLDLMVSEEVRHTWSPILSLEVEPDGQGGSLVRGRYGPHPNVWTFFIWLYACCAFVTVISGMYGVAQGVLQQTPWAWLFTVSGIMGAGTVYFAALTGQKLGHDQMEILVTFLDAAAATVVEGREPPPTEAQP